MQAGLLREWIVFEKEEVQTDKFGGSRKTWVEVFRKRARVQYKSGDEVEQNHEMFHTEVYTMTVRYQPGITNDMRILWDNKKYRIRTSYRDRAQMALIIKCELINE